MNKVSYSRTTNLGSFNSEKIELSIEYEELEEGQTANDVFEEAKKKVMAWAEIPESLPTVTRTNSASLGVDTEPPLCEICNSPMRQVDGRNGLFWGCTNYPNCDFTKNIPKTQPF